MMAFSVEGEDVPRAKPVLVFDIGMVTESSDYHSTNPVRLGVVHIPHEIGVSTSIKATVRFVAKAEAHSMRVGGLVEGGVLDGAYISSTPIILYSQKLRFQSILRSFGKD